LNHLLDGGLRHFGELLRSGQCSAAEVTQALIETIRVEDEKLQAFVHLDELGAMASARAVDESLAMGGDLGPLAGVPVVIKDLVQVEGMPPASAGSRLDVSDLIGPEGDFVRRLRALGCVLLGKTRMIEFAAGAHNMTHPTPWNPCDPEIHRSPAGSSNGSAVAMAAGLTGFAIGSDTGGSVRVPAAFCGVFGLKTSRGLWPLDGVFPLSSHLDTLGVFSKSADDAALIFSAIEGEEEIQPPALKHLRMGYERAADLELTSTVAAAYENALRLLDRVGVELVELSSWQDEALVVDEIFSRLVAGDLRMMLGENRLKHFAHELDPVVQRRLDGAKGVGKPLRQALEKELERLKEKAIDRMDGLDGILSPTAPVQSPPLMEIADTDVAVRYVAEALRLSRFANVQDYCAVSVPIEAEKAALPIGLQIAAGPGQDGRLLAMARALESVVAGSGE
jgi:aspartyl-tRNA(Asn)/glutamyl-tRNA(Gln) amidotransferase subunit A